MDNFCGSAFWNRSLTVDTPNPDLTPCFQKTVLVWVPCGFLFLCSPVYMYLLANSNKPRIQHTWLNLSKIVIAALAASTQITDLFYCIKLCVLDGKEIYGADVTGPAINLIALAVAMVFIQYSRLKGERSSGFMFMFWMLHTIAGICILKYKIGYIIQHGESDSLVNLATAIIFFTLTLTEMILANFVDGVSESKLEDGSNMNPCPERAASFLSRITFWWFTGLVIKGYKKPLDKRDLWSLNPSDQAKSVVPVFEKEWNKEMKKVHRKTVDCQKSRSVQNSIKNDIVELSHLMKNNDNASLQAEMPHDTFDDGYLVITDKKSTYQPRLVKAVCRTFGRSMLATAFFKLCNDILIFVSPQILKLIIEYVRQINEKEGEDYYAWKGYAYAILMFITSFIQSMILHQYFHTSFVVGMRLRTAVISLIYRKTLRLSNAARHSSSVGEVTNMMAVDAQQFADIVSNINLIWSVPFQMCIAVYLLWQELGQSVLAGLGVMVILLPFNACIAKITRNLQVIQLRNKDKRVKLMSEILNGIKVLKLYAWELLYQQKVLGIRDKELNVLKKAAYLNATTTFTWTCAPFLVTLTTFAVYVMSSPDNVMTPSKAFVSLALFNILRFPMSLLPMFIASLVQVSVSVKRIEDYLKKDELNKDAVQHNTHAKSPVIIDHGTFTWDLAEPPLLKDITIDIKPGSLVAVVGSVGSGKSSLLAAILGEMDKLKGKINVKGEVAYVPQQAWMQQDSLRNNILLGKEMDRGLYYKVLNTCALEADLSMLPAADMTEIGEKGINLSGGQKQRINLARAIYQDADIYLLDDPLSAVDAHVGKHIFDAVISKNGVLKNKTRILVTHGISFLPHVDKIIVLEKGRISETGSYKQLLSASTTFAEILKNCLLEDEEMMEEIEEDKNLRDEIISCIGDVCFLKSGREISKAEAERHGAVLRQISLPHSPHTSSPMSRQLSRITERQLSRHIERQLTRQLTQQKSLNASIHSRDEYDGDDNDMADIPISAMGRKFTRQITIADDECQPPQALLGKVQETDKLMQTEHIEKGRVRLSVFLTYMRAVGIKASVLIIFFYVLSNVASMCSNFWLSAWSMDSTFITSNNITGNWTGNNTILPAENVTLRLGIYAALGLLQGVFVMAASFVFADGRIHAASCLHSRMLSNILHCPLDFFDVTPLGRISNRFSKDIDVIDMVIPSTIVGFLMTFLASICSLLIIIINTPIFIAVMIPLSIIYYFIQSFYVASSRQLKRMESVTRSPIYSHFGETIQGIRLIRAYRQQDRFIAEADRRLDENQRCYYPNISSNRWLSVRLELVGNFTVLFATLFVVIAATKGTIDPGTVGLSISYAMTITATLNVMVRMTSEVETNIVAVERVREYTEAPTEAPWTVDCHKPPDNWPSGGQIEFIDYSMRYRPGLPLVLHGITAKIAHGERIGVVGRTGAGKSSLTLALFRVIEPARGMIFIDGINITDIGLHNLRSKLTIIPQDPVIFSGTLRSNLDPFGTCPESDIWRAVEQAHLKEFVEAVPEGLEFICSDGGENLSVGQRQLVCLARALLRKTKILIMDEATAAVDVETDDLIQSTVRMEFTDCTVFTIAHRLNTVMDYDRILVLDAGQIAEFDSPQELLKKKSGIFYTMAKDAGLAE